MWINWLIIAKMGLRMRVKFIIRKWCVKGLELRVNGVLIGLWLEEGIIMLTDSYLLIQTHLLLRVERS